MKKIKRICLLFVVVFIQSGNTRILFVDTNHASSSDANPGTEAQPWKTIQKAARSVQPGDTVYIKRGTYKGEVKIERSGQPASGKDEPDRLIVFAAFPGDEHLVILDGSRLLLSEASYIQISGLRIQNTNNEGIAVRGMCEYVILTDNHTFDTYGSGISVWGVDWGKDPNDYGYDIIRDIRIEGNKIEKACNGGWNECITLANGVNGFQILDNEVFNGGDPVNGGEGIDIKEGCRNGIIGHNVVYDLTRRGIYLDGGGHMDWDTPPVHNIHVAYNRVYSNSISQGMAVMTEGSADVHDIFIYNNLFYDNGEDGIMFYDHPNGEGDIYDITVVNNTCYDNKRFGILLNFQDARNMIFRNNICYKSGNSNIEYEAGEYEASHNLTGNPQFVDAVTGDFHLTADSPAIDAGTAENAATDDFEGNSRPCGAGYDIGAYEYGCGGSAVQQGESIRQPGSFLLRQNYPNPFNALTVLEFDLAEEAEVKLVISDIRGRTVARVSEGRFGRGTHRMRWHASDPAGGVYFANLSVKNAEGRVQRSVIKMLLQN